MRKILLLSLILLGFYLLVSCDDFFSPNIEIFNNIKTPVDIKQDNKEENIITDIEIDIACLF